MKAKLSLFPPPPTLLSFLPLLTSPHCLAPSLFSTHLSYQQRDRLDSTDSRVLDGDLLDDVLTAPSSLPKISKQRSHTPTNDDEVLVHTVYILYTYIIICIYRVPLARICLLVFFATGNMSIPGENQLITAIFFFFLFFELSVLPSKFYVDVLVPYRICTNTSVCVHVIVC